MPQTSSPPNSSLRRPESNTATAKFPDGTTQTARFVVFDDNLEQTEVATDAGYLRSCAKAARPALAAQRHLNKLLAELRNDKVEAAPIRKLTSIWDRVWVLLGDRAALRDRLVSPPALGAWLRRPRRAGIHFTPGISPAALNPQLSTFSLRLMDAEGRAQRVGKHRDAPDGRDVFGRHAQLAPSFCAWAALASQSATEM